jgi:hypothetical protein
MNPWRAALPLMLAAALSACRHGDEAPAPTPRSVEAALHGATIRVSTEASEIRAGEPLRIVVALERGAQTSATLPTLGKKLGPFEVRQSESLPRDPAKPDQVAERVTLVTFESGPLEVPPLEAVIRGADGKDESLRSPALPVTVQSRLAGEFNPASFRDIKGEVDVPLDAQWPWFVGAGLLAAALGLGAWRLWFHRPAPPPVVEAPHERALRELDELAARDLPRKGLVLDFYVLLSDTVRRYVEGRFGIRAPEQTTKEFLSAARHHPQIGEDHQRLLASFLRAADMVKFAAQRPGPQECERGLDAARGFVRESAPAEAPADAAAAPDAPQEART